MELDILTTVKQYPNLVTFFGAQFSLVKFSQFFCTCTNARALAHAHRLPPSLPHSPTHALTHSLTHSLTHIHTQRHTHIQTLTHTHAHPHTCTGACIIDKQQPVVFEEAHILKSVYYARPCACAWPYMCYVCPYMCAVACVCMCGVACVWCWRRHTFAKVN